jgi:hypothetical protein
MKLPKIFETSSLHEDIERGMLTEASFAAEFWAVVARKAPKVYKDPADFFKKTYRTSDLRAILVNALRRTAKGSGSPAVIISTEFGGGKTHALIALYHTFVSPNEARTHLDKWGVLREADVLSPPESKVVVFDGRNVSPSAEDRPRTLWGVLAEQLGSYAELKKYDKQGKPPALDIINEAFLREEPVVFLLDEVVYYLANAESEVVGNTTLARLTVNFLMALMTAVAHSERSLLILTLTGEQAAFKRYVDEIARKAKAGMSAEEQEELEEQLRVLAGDLQSLAARVSSFGSPVRAEEVYGVVKARLFREVDESAAEKAAKEFFSFYHSRAENFPERARETTYLDRLRKSYPIHPELIDILYERVSTIPDFQRTRGLLRLLALILRDVYKKKPEEAYYVMPYFVDLTNSEILGELTDKLGRGEFRPVIASDIARQDGTAKAQRIDSRLEVKTAKKVATSIYFYSLIGAGRESGCTHKDLNLCLLNPDEDPTPVATALGALKKELWYIHESGAMYFFTTEPNINAVIDDYMKVVGENDVREQIEKILEGHFKKPTIFKPIIWIDEVPDNREPKLIVIDYQKGTTSDAKPPRYVETLYERVEEGGQLRTFKNTVFFLVCQEGLKEQMLEEGRRYAAAIAAEKDERVKMDRRILKKLLAKKSESKTSLNASVAVSYRYLYYPGEGGLKTFVLSPITGTKTLVEACYEAVKDRKIFEMLSPDVIVEKLDPWRHKEEPTVTDILDMFKTYPDLPLPKTDKVIYETLRKGVADSFFGYRNGKDHIDEFIIVEADGKIIKKEEVKKPPAPPTPPTIKVAKPEGPPTALPTPKITAFLSYQNLADLNKIDPSKRQRIASIRFKGGLEVAAVATQFKTLALKGAKGSAILQVNLGKLLNLSGTIPLDLLKLSVIHPLNSLSSALKVKPNVEILFSNLEGVIADENFKDKIGKQAEVLFKVDKEAVVEVELD